MPKKGYNSVSSLLKIEDFIKANDGKWLSAEQIYREFVFQTDRSTVRSPRSMALIVRRYHLRTIDEGTKPNLYFCERDKIEDYRKRRFENFITGL